MRPWIRSAAALATVACVAYVAEAKNDHSGGGGNATGRPARAKSFLTSPDEGSNDRGRVEMKFFPERKSRAERSWLRFKIRHLEPNADYTIWIDDPSTEEVDLVQVGDAFTTNDRGNRNVFRDTKKGDVLPFESDLVTLSGLAVEVRDAGDAVVLEGNLPAIQ